MYLSAHEEPKNLVKIILVLSLRFWLRQYRLWYLNLSIVFEDLSRTGGLAVGVPGSVAGILEVHKKMGSLPLNELIQPSIELAKRGFVVTEKQAKSLNSKRNEFIKVNGDNTFYGKVFKTRCFCKQRRCS